MLSRREFLGWVSGMLAIRGPEGREKGTPVHKRERPAESVQNLIQQIRFLEQGDGRKAHVQAIQDQIRVRLLLAGLACVYVEEDGRHYVCALETRTGCLWCLPLRQASLPWSCEAWERIGLGGLENRVKTLSRACDI
jgi:hypothetical protein